MFLFIIFFFFQAEDGIRDYKVTGVQTCALPILGGVGDGGAAGERAIDAHDHLDGAGGRGGEVAHGPGDDTRGEDPAGGGGDEGSVGRDGVGEDDAGGVAVTGSGESVLETESSGAELTVVETAAPATGAVSLESML